MRPPPPMSPTVLPQTNAPSRCIDCPPGNAPARTRRSPSTTRRATASRSPKCRSAVASLTMGGTTVTGIRRAVAAATSISEGVIFIEAIARRLALAAMTSQSTRSCSRQNRISCSRTAARSSSWVMMCTASGFHSTSATLRKRSIALFATGCVMNTRGRIEIRWGASAHPANDPSDAVDSDLRSIRNALCGIEHAQDHRDAALSGERSEVRRTATELRHHAGYARQYLTQCRAGDPRHQDIARCDAGELAFAVDHAGAAGSPAYACRMPVEPRVAQPDFVGDRRRFQVQRPRLEQLEPHIVQRPFDFHRHAQNVLDLPEQLAKLHRLRAVEARLGSERAPHGTRTVNAADAMEFPAGHRVAQRQLPFVVAAGNDAIRYHLALGYCRAESPSRVQDHVAIRRRAQS